LQWKDQEEKVHPSQAQQRVGAGTREEEEKVEMRAISRLFANFGLRAIVLEEIHANSLIQWKADEEDVLTGEGETGQAEWMGNFLTRTELRLRIQQPIQMNLGVLKKVRWQNAFVGTGSLANVKKVRSVLSFIQARCGEWVAVEDVEQEVEGSTEVEEVEVEDIIIPIIIIIMPIPIIIRLNLSKEPRKVALTSPPT
jgi:hypothetical protein